MCDRIKYEHFEELPQLVADKIVSCRPHPRLPLNIYNYTVRGQMTPIAQWTEAMMDCRGLILDHKGYVVGRPFRKFWNYEQMLDQIPSGESFEVWEKLDGSLGIACEYAGEVVCATRGSFESDQSKWFQYWIDTRYENFHPSGETWLFEIIYPENRIVVDYGNRSEAVLLAVMSPDGAEIPTLFDGCTRFTKARRFDGVTDFSAIDTDPQFAGEEGFVVKWSNGFMAKCKLTEYKRLHRLITQCSTRTIWELLRAGTGIKELVDRVPVEFAEWVNQQARELKFRQSNLEDESRTLFWSRNKSWSRKEFAEWATTHTHPGLLFALLDDKPISDTCWRTVEPKWSTPFRKETEE